MERFSNEIKARHQWTDEWRWLIICNVGLGGGGWCKAASGLYIGGRPVQLGGGRGGKWAV